ncbi:hypothetical protein DM790_22620 [Flavobacterium collinsii]|nr:hypothetical protein [Flavobacterium collinsii]
MTEKSKISDNASYAKLKTDVLGFSTLGRLIKIFSFFGTKNDKLENALSALPALKKETEHFLHLPDRFNGHFSKSGWIAHESMNMPIIEKAVDLADQDQSGKAEDELADYFTSPQIGWLLNRFMTSPELALRYNLIEFAYRDTLEKRFYSVVPLLLMVIDGIVNDISKSKGFFSEGTDLIAWDSIAAHSSGLSSIRDIFNAPRKKTNDLEIFLPYRNGIIHGRDLKYDNKYVAGKCWCTLFAIFDWKQALQKQKDNPPAEVKNPTVRESLRQIRKTLSDYQKHRISHSKLMKEIEQWKPREIDPSEIKRETFKAYSPEKEVDALLKNWLNKNYGNIAAQQHQFASKDVNLGKEAGKVRSELHDKILKEGEIISIKDESPAVSVIVMRVKYEFNGALMEKEIALRMICNSESGGTAINGQDNIKWRFINKFMYNLYF